MRERLADVVDRVIRALERRAAQAPDRTQRLAATVDVLGKDYAGFDRGVPDRLGGVVDLFGLDELDAALLACAAAPDVDLNLAMAYGLLRGADDPTRASVGLLLELAGLPTVSADGFARLGPGSRLREGGLLEVADAGPWLAREVHLPDRLTAHLLGCDDLDVELVAAVTPCTPLDLAGADAVAAAVRAGSLVWVRARHPAAGPSLAAGAFATLGLQSLVLDLRRLPKTTSLPAFLRSATREAALRGVGLIVVGCERFAETDPVSAARTVESAVVPVVLVANRPWDPAWLARHPFVIDAAPLDESARSSAWQAASGFTAAPEGLGALRLTPESISQTAEYAQLLSSVDGEPVSDAVLFRAARVVGGSHAAGKRSTATLSDLVLPERTEGELRRLLSWGRHREEALSRSRMFGDDRGDSRKGAGIAALFGGSPGTGKTLSANVVAGELGLDLFQVNLNEIVDKYIGETEKNLERVFQQAESLNVVLFFDEADALFGSRSEVKDAHDRYANQEVAYLLQRIEQFDGITILATNLRGNLDQAFTRRLQFIIHFPDPDAATRRKLWELYIGRLDFLDPADLPDFDRLATTFELAGGDVRNVVLSAVYDAIGADKLLGMRHLVRAAVNEYQKLGRRLPAGTVDAYPEGAQPQ